MWTLSNTTPLLVFASLLRLSEALNYVEVLKQRGAVVLGTENGYDRGGSDPICWVSTYESNSNIASSVQSVEESAATLLNEDFLASIQGGNASGVGVYLLPRCFPHTSIFVEVLPSPVSNTTIYTESEYTFTIQVTVNQSALLGDEGNDESSGSGANAIHGRLLLCHAFDYGFCNPISNLHGEGDSTMEDHLSANGDGSSLYSSSWVTQPLNPSNGEENPDAIISISLHAPENMLQGPYVAVAHVFLTLKNGNNATATRLDVAGTLPEKIIDIRQRPLLREVSLAAKATLGGMIVLCGSFALFLLVVILVRREHAVMRLAQGPFLAAITAGCLVQTCCSFVLLPTRDIHCRLFGVLIMMPMTFVSCCIVGRIWRVYRTLSIANRIGRRGSVRDSGGGDTVVSTLTSIANFPTYSPAHRNDRPTRRSSSIRQTISTTETANLVLALTLPQVLLQVLSAVFRDRDLILITDDTGTMQRFICEGDPTVSTIGTAYAIALSIIAVWLAWISRHLPSSFNEKDQVYIAASVCLITIFTSVSLRDTLEAPDFSPDVAVLAVSFLSLIVPANILAVVVYPKVRRVLSGEKVVISSALEGKFSMRRRATLQHTSSETAASWHHRHSSPRPTAITDENRRTSLQDDDPLPIQIESLMFNVQRVLRNVTDTITQGRAPDRRDIAVLGEETAMLADELLLIDFAHELGSTPTPSTEVRTASGNDDTDPKNEKHVTFSSESMNL